MVEERVFCIDCKYLRNTISGDFKCNYPLNIEVITKRTWLTTESTTRYLKSPKELNQFNDCPWFEMKGEEYD